MQGMINWIKSQFYNFSFPSIPKNIGVIDIVQIIIIAWFVYHLILWVKHTKAYLLLKGILVVAVFIVIANILHMDVILYLFRSLSVAAITAIVIIFQPELRRVLEQIGDKNFLDNLMILGGGPAEEDVRFSDQTLNEIVRASFEMGEVKTGALIVIEQNISWWIMRRREFQ